ncbi:MAG: NCS2 family permease [Butyricicoccus sp.]|nr:NCS2 family permease [Butyricicoccus sp.]MBQ8584769.1 NCS2 family permease [Butyricicoccus sp.]
MQQRIAAKLNSFFNLSKSKTTVRTEVLAGITTFITVAYILILNPQILSHPYQIMGDMDMATRISNGVFIGTCLASFVGTILCALYAKVPFVQAPGMGLNAFFAYTVVLAMGYTYSQSLVVVFISGVLFIVITAIGVREAIIRAIPDSVINAVTPGVGLFITIIGLKNSGLVVSNEATLVSLVDFSQWRTPGADLSGLCGALIALIGLVTIGVLHIKKVRGSIFLGIIVATIAGIPLGVTTFDGLSFDIAGKFTDFMEISFLQLDFKGLFSGTFDTIFAVIMLIISFSLVNMFDSIGTLWGAAKQSGMMDEDGEIIGMKQALMSDAISTAAGAMLGTSTVTTVVESSAGIAAGGRTGLTSLTTAILFLASLVLAPVVGIIPSAATAPALIFVGVLMLSNVKDVDLNNMETALPAFCTIVFMPFTYSIANGIALGLIMHCLIQLFTGKVRNIKPLTVIISLIFIARYAFMTLG